MVKLALLLLFLPLIALGEETRPKVRTKLGLIEGTWKVSEPSSRQFSSFEGIPYAMPPLDFLRFAPPILNSDFYKPGEALQATRQGIECPQVDLTSREFKGSEDCLYLNIFTPETSFLGGAEYPVMVWFHGGGFQYGSSSSEHYGPERLLEEDVVLVTVNYRLGPLGFLTTGDQEAIPNIGILDQQLALKWIRENIEMFAGSPSQVTLFGADAGGSSVMAHLASPGSKGLFHRAISMGGVWSDHPTLHKSYPPAHYAGLLAVKLGCDSDQNSLQMVECLREKDAEDIVIQAANLFPYFSFVPEPFSPSVDGYMPHPVLPQPVDKVWEDQTFSPQIPLMIGGNKDAGILLLMEFLTDDEKFANLTQNFETLGSTLLLGVDPDKASDEGELATASLLRNIYTEDEGSKFSREVFIQLFTEVHFHAHIDKTVRELAEKIPVFYYNYQYQGSFSLPQAFGLIEETYGVSHMDELFLMFKFAQVSGSWLGDLALQTEDDLTVSGKLVRLWTHFAKTGRPTEDGSWRSVRDAKKTEFAVIDEKELRMEFHEEEVEKRLHNINSILNLGRLYRNFYKPLHPALGKIADKEEKFHNNEETKDHEENSPENKDKNVEQNIVNKEGIDPWAEFESEFYDEKNDKDEYNPVWEMKKLIEEEQRGVDFDEVSWEKLIEEEKRGFDFDEDSWEGHHDEL